jgi:quercetin dioxygenase-like cupin family protein
VVAGDSIENPLTGERITFVRTAADTGGELLELEATWTRRGMRTQEHVHPEMEERFEVLSGDARFRIAGEERSAGPGDVVTVPAGTRHVAWNPSDGEARLRLQFRPALRWEDFVDRLFTLARKDRMDALPQLMSEFPREIAPPATLGYN